MEGDDPVDPVVVTIPAELADFLSLRDFRSLVRACQVKKDLLSAENIVSLVKQCIAQRRR